MENFVIRVKSKSGQKIVDTLTPDDTITKLKNKLSEVTGIQTDALHVLRGFPPKPLNLTDINITLKESDILPGETLIVEEKHSMYNGEQRVVDLPRTHITDTLDFGDNPGVLMKMVVPADDSCLFTSVGFVLNGTLINI
jgi:ubiquitin thioesterase OTU1